MWHSVAQIQHNLAKLLFFFKIKNGGANFSDIKILGFFGLQYSLQKKKISCGGASLNLASTSVKQKSE